MKISVLITTRNTPDFLGKVLEGYLRQVRPPDEVIVADDGSGSPTLRLVEQIRSRAHFPVIHAWQEHRGIQLSKLRNHGTRQATGDYIIYTDGDCVPGRYFVYDHERIAKPGWFVQGTRMWIKRRAIQDFRGDESTPELFRLWLSGRMTKVRYAIRLPGLSVERRNLRGTRSCNLGVFLSDVFKINGWNEDFTGFMRQDTEFCLRLMRSGVRRRDPISAAVSFHLEHDKHVDSADLQRNNRLLEQAKTAPIYVARGLFAKPAPEVMGDSFKFPVRAAA